MLAHIDAQLAACNLPKSHAASETGRKAFAAEHITSTHICLQKGRRERETFSFLKSSTLSNWFKALDCSPLHSSSPLRRYGEICERQSHVWFEKEKEKTKPKEKINVTTQKMRLMHTMQKRTGQ